MEMSWPEGLEGPTRIVGRGRDLLTLDREGRSRALNNDQLLVEVGPDMIITHIEANPNITGLGQLVGQSAISGFRKGLAEVVNSPAIEERPMFLLLDDIVGCNIISTWVTVRWRQPDLKSIDRTSHRDVCIGYATGSSAMSDKSPVSEPQLIPPLQPIDDPDAFHGLAPDVEKQMRRVRRIDMWRDDGFIGIDAMFQDSGVLRGSKRAGVHEYRLFARVCETENGLELTEVEAVSGILPYTECLGASQHISRLYGTPLTKLRALVLKELRGPIGCTHLNDTLRSLAAAAPLAAMLS